MTSAQVRSIPRGPAISRRIHVGILLDRICNFHRCPSTLLPLVNAGRCRVVVPPKRHHQGWAHSARTRHVHGFCGIVLRSGSSGTYKPIKPVDCCCTAQIRTPHARHLRGDFREPAARSDRVGAAEHAAEPAGAVLQGRRTVGEGPDGFTVLLDGRPVRTPARRPLGRAGARAGARRWPPNGMPSRTRSIRPRCRSRGSPIRSSTAWRPHPGRSRRRSSSISAPICCSIAPRRRPVWLQAQRRIGIPVIDWAREHLGARFVLAEGHRACGAAGDGDRRGGRARSRPAPTSTEAWRLGALSVVTTLTGSALLALALAAGRLTADEAWAAAHVDEDWNM